MKETISEIFKSDKTSLNDWLAEDEEIIWRGTPKRKAYVLEESIKLMPFAIIWLLVDSVMIIAATTALINEKQYLALAGVYAFILVHLTPVWLWIGTMVRANRKSKSVSYLITNKRIIEYNISCNLVEHDMLVSDLTHVEGHASATDKMLNVGDVYLTGKNGVMAIHDQPDYVSLAAKLTKITQNKSKTTEYITEDIFFASKKKVCAYCNSTLSGNVKSKCPYCGANVQ